jgi:hypothetical protein
VLDKRIALGPLERFHRGPLFRDNVVLLSVHCFDRPCYGVV